MKIYTDAEKALEAASKKPKPVDSLIAKNFGSEKSIEQLSAKRTKRAERKDKKLPKDRKCPRCKNIKVDRNRWILDLSICRACHKKEKVEAGNFELAVDSVESLGTRFEIEKFDKAFLLGTATLISRMFGEPWTQTMIVNIQKKRQRTISAEQKEFIEKHYRDFIFRPTLEKFRIKDNKLVEIRNGIGVSQRDFARQCKWTREKQRRIEDEIVFITKDELETIKKVIDFLCE